MNDIILILKYIILGYWNLFLDKIRILTPEQKELYDKRLKICQNCNFFDNKFCILCECYIPAKVKVDYGLDENEKSIDGCPMLKW